MSKTPEKANNESKKFDEMFEKLEKGDCSGVESFMPKFLPKIVKILKNSDPKINSIIALVKKDESKKFSDNNVGFHAYMSTDSVVDLGSKKQPLEVMFSSIEQENEQMLHLLFNKTRTIKEIKPRKSELPKKSELEQPMKQKELQLEKLKKEKVELEQLQQKLKRKIKARNLK